MAACRDELTVSEEDVVSSEYWIAVAEDICGMACLDADGRSGELHAFFIAPEVKRQGIGRLLWGKLVASARAHGLQELRLDADPAALPFYQALGFKTVGRTPSRSIEGRYLPHMTFSL